MISPITDIMQDKLLAFILVPNVEKIYNYTNTFRFTRIPRWDQFKSMITRQDQNALSAAR